MASLLRRFRSGSAPVEDADPKLTVVEHLGELRKRLIRAALAFGAGSIVAYIFYVPLLDLLLSPLDAGGKIGGVEVGAPNVGGITTAFVVRLKVSIFFGLVIALPVILWQIWRFIVPGLHSKERKFGIWFVMGSLVLFALGTMVAFIVLPQAIGFLLTFTQAPLKPLIFIDQYLSFVSFMVLAFGLSFEFPLLLAFLAGIGVVTSAKLSRWRRQAVFFTAIFAAVATPSQDPYSMLLMALPLYILYEFSLLFIRFVMRK